MTSANHFQTDALSHPLQVGQSVYAIQKWRVRLMDE